MSDSPLIASLLDAVASKPDDTVLRLHLAEVLIAAGRGTEAVSHLAQVLAVDPGADRARELMAAALTGPTVPTAAEAGVAPEPESAPEPAAAPQPTGFDWEAAEDDLGDLVPPSYADGAGPPPTAPAYDVETGGLTLADVGGMTEVKKRLNAAFLAPLRNPQLRQLYAKSLKGGLMLYGPPGCGKTYIARALAGELGAKFMTVSLADILDLYVGESEKNVHEIFEVARANAPCVLFLDEVDAIGHKRSHTSSDSIRNAVNQLLLELDGVGANNEGVFVLSATNHPWDVDPALRRPGRFDRTLLVLPPDAEARSVIWQHHLKDRPLERVDLTRLVKLSEGYTGADIAHACDSAAEIALMHAAETGDLRMIQMADLEEALRGVRPSLGPWFATARNVAMFANDDGTYDELLAYLRKHKKL